MRAEVEALRILLFCWEAGSAGALAPAANYALGQGYEVVDASLAPGRDILRQFVPGLADVSSIQDPRAVADVALAGLGHPRHEQGWRRWKMLRDALPAFVLMDHWKGVERFTSASGALNRDVLSVRIGVIDTATKQRLAAFGIQNTQVDVVGNMACYGTGETIATLDAAAIRRRLGLEPARPLYFLASETVHTHHFHQQCNAGCHPLEAHRLRSGESLLEWALSQAKRSGAVLAVRPHPNQIAAGGDSDGVRVIPWAQATDNEVLSIATRIFGLSTMINAKAVAAGIDTVNVAGLLDAWRPEQAFLGAEHWRELYEQGSLGTPDGARRQITQAQGNPERILNALRNLNMAEE